MDIRLRDRVRLALLNFGRSLQTVYTSKTLICIIISLGVVLRLVQYLYDRSLWIDELNLAMNIRDYGLMDLFGPLQLEQYAPVGFLLFVKTATLIFGQSDYALRLFPLVCGIISVPLFYLLSKEILKPLAVPIGLALFATAQPLIYYSSEFKQFGVDVLAVIVVYLLFFYYSGKANTARAIAVLSLCGAVLIWFSHPIVFVLAGVGATLLLLSPIDNNRGQFVSLAIIFSVCLLSFALSYFVSIKYGVASEHLQEHWAKDFAPIPASWEGVKWYYASLYDILASRTLLHLVYPVVWMVILLIGVLSLAYSDGRKALLLVSPIVITVFASALHLYPFYQRLIVFMLPIVILLLVYGLWEIAGTLLKKTPTIVFGLFLVLLLFAPLHDRKGFTLFRPILFHHEEVKPVFEYISEGKREGDLLYCYWGAKRAYSYYSDRYGIDDMEFVQGIVARGDPERYLQDILEKAGGHTRVWILYSHVYVGKEGSDIGIAVDRLNKQGRKIDACISEGAGAMLYDLSGLK